MISNVDFIYRPFTSLAKYVDGSHFLTGSVDKSAKVLLVISYSCFFLLVNFICGWFVYFFVFYCKYVSFGIPGPWLLSRPTWLSAQSMQLQCLHFLIMYVFCMLIKIKDWFVVYIQCICIFAIHVLFTSLIWEVIYHFSLLKLMDS